MQLLTALITPFTPRHKIDYEALENLLEDQIAADVSGIVLLGTTGEAELLEENEKYELLDFSCRVVNGRLPITVGCGHSSTSTTIDMAKKFSDFPIEQVMVVMPPYVKPSMEGLYSHFKALDEENIPFIAYHHPFRTGLNPNLKTLERILSLPRCRGLKDASGGCEIMLKLAPHFDIFSGDDLLTLPHLSLGAKGTISVASNIIPREMKSILDTFLINPNKALEDFHFVQPLIESLFLEPNPIGIKTALQIASKICGSLRAPYTDASLENKAAIERAYISAFPNSIDFNPSSLKV
jgi:4-hydroxy-tetrahydrodipicolinate synthase